MTSLSESKDFLQEGSTMQTKTALIDMIRNMNSLDEVNRFAQMTNSALKLLNVEQCYLFMYDVTDEIAYLAYSLKLNEYGELVSNSKHDYSVSIHQDSIVGEVTKRRKVHVVHDWKLEPFTEMDIFDEKSTPKNSITLPIIDANSQIGAIMHCVNKRKKEDTTTKRNPRLSLASADALALQVEKMSHRTIQGESATKKRGPFARKRRSRGNSFKVRSGSFEEAKALSEPESPGHVDQVVQIGFSNKAFSDEDIETGILIAEVGAIPVMYAQLNAKAKREVKKRMDIQRLMDGISGSMNPEDIGDQIIMATREILNVQTVTVWLVDKERGNLEAKFSYDSNVLHCKAPLEGSIVGTCCTTKELVIIDDAQIDKRLHKQTDKETGFKTNNVIAVPIPEPTGEVIAVIQAINKTFKNSDKPAPFSAEDKKIVKFMASQAGIALMKSRLHAEARYAKLKGDIVLNLVKCTSDPNTSLIDISDSICNSVADLVRAERVTIYFVDPQNKELWIAFAKDAALQGRKLKIGDGVAGKVALYGQPMVVDDAQRNKQVNTKMASDTSYVVYNMLCAPIFGTQDKGRSDSIESTDSSPKAIQKKSPDSPSTPRRRNKRKSSMSESLHLALTGRTSVLPLASHGMPLAVIQAINKSEGGFETSFTKADLDNLEEICVEIGAIINLRWNEIKYLKVLVDANNKQSDTNESSYIRELFDSKTLARVHTTFEKDRKSGPNTLARLHRKNSDLSVQWKKNRKLDKSKEMATMGDVIDSSEDEVEENATQEMKDKKRKMRRRNKSLRMVDVNRRDLADAKYDIHNWDLDIFEIPTDELVQQAYNVILLDVFSVMVAGFVHDVDHPGNDNTFERKTLSMRALMHNDSSILERHHCAVAFKTLLMPQNNFTVEMTDDLFTYFRSSVINSILATDLVHHSAMVADLSKKKLEQRFEMTKTKFDSESTDDRKMLMQAILHSSDLVAQTLSEGLAIKWSLCINMEFKAQIKLQETRSPPIPVVAYMQNLSDPCVRLRNQIMFIDRTLAPLFDVMACHFPELQCRVIQLGVNRVMYSEMLEEENARKEGKLETKIETIPGFEDRRKHSPLENKFLGDLEFHPDEEEDPYSYLKYKTDVILSQPKPKEKEEILEVDLDSDAEIEAII
eukprot:g356.t1